MDGKVSHDGFYYQQSGNSNSHSNTGNSDIANNTKTLTNEQVQTDAISVINRVIRDRKDRIISMYGETVYNAIYKHVADGTIGSFKRAIADVEQLFIDEQQLKSLI